MTHIQKEELEALFERIINSGVLGRSKTYGAILRYLAECSQAGKTPKEAAIAVDVLGRDADFDVAKDSIVRVHIFHLRNKINQYYALYGKQEKFRLTIPKGQYIVTFSLNEESGKEDVSISGQPLTRNSWTPWLAALASVLLLLNLLVRDEPADSSSPVLAPVASLQPWQSLLDDELPILIVVGDYYIFGEVDEAGNVTRMVREFNINSPEDLPAGDTGPDRFLDLDLSYLPTSVANAMLRVIPVLASKASMVSVKMMSELETADLADNHLVYLGYLSGIEPLLDLMFADSGLSIGATYDELVDLETNRYYIGSSGLSGAQSFQDYGMVSTFPAPNGNHFLLVAGMRDEGLINISRELTSLNSLATLQDNLGGQGLSFEALYEVQGFDHTNFGGELVYSRPLDTRVIWETRLINQ
ncbi:MAG: hypothetical protein ACO2YY_09380 [Pseudohongiellaceae bacterium]